jgi:hypothetical protein
LSAVAIPTTIRCSRLIISIGNEILKSDIYAS